MIEALLLAAANPAMRAIDAERAFAAQAQEAGQWTAFRNWSAPEAIMFTPNAGSAQAFLNDRKDPPIAVYWWPGRSFVSCDGNLAVNSGPWVREGGKTVGYFTTVWQRQPDGGWKWLLDHGDSLPAMRAEGGDIEPAVAACSKPVPSKPPRGTGAATEAGGGSSKDGTLHWGWTVEQDGSRNVFAMLWDGKEHRMVIDDKVAPGR
ncbi:YybH family protein [Sphingomonas xanthus]|uniref:DUF4440 domain-containing protein n=1 Tax=Sphingomonas xanthus TaxID=2594473 RepID=A0A516IRC7_9SPHN|nr:hypothetical protein [Sphingomonas xanthus]QDP19450.1 hypothetical protein FMM02_05420 [Sphingomonas xanthus]